MGVWQLRGASILTRRHRTRRIPGLRRPPPRSLGCSVRADQVSQEHTPTRSCLSLSTTAAALGLLWLAASAALVPAASAQTLEQLLPVLAGGGYSEKAEAVAVLGASGDPRAAAVLRALLDANLYARKDGGGVVIGEPRGDVLQLRDPLTLAGLGQAAVSDLDRARVNNRVRGVIRTALGALQLLDADPAVRRQSASALFRSRSADMIPFLESALAQEENEKVRKAVTRTLTASRLDFSDDPAVRLAAVRALESMVDRNVRALLAGLVAAIDGEEAPAAEAIALRVEAAAAIVEIDQRLAAWAALGNVLQGISLGSVLMLAAIGLAITFGVMGVINLAHGEMVMLGAYATFMVQELFRAYAPEWFDWSLLVAIPAAFVVAGAVGIAIERGIIRFLYGRPLETLLATWGLSLVLRQAVRSIFGPTNKEVGNPSWMSGALDIGGGVLLTYNRIWIILFALMVFAMLIFIQRRTRFGLQMRAVTQNRAMARSMGIRSARVDAFTFGLGSGVAGMAGVALSQIDNVSPNLGQGYIVDSFMVVVFGGVGNLWGTLVGGFLLGIVSKFLEPYAGAVLGKIFVLIAIILFIQWRPRGLFALRGRAAEA